MERDIIFFDLETTGVDTQQSRVVQIAATKLKTNGEKEHKQYLINPTIPIPQEASEVHGIYDEDVKDSPTFKELSKNMKAFFSGCDLGGYNSDKFDIPLLNAEFERAGQGSIDWEFNSVDVFSLYRKLFPNSLGDVYKRLVGKDLENAHDAKADIDATMEILEVLKKDFSDLPDNTKELEDFIYEDKKRVDLSGFFYEKDDEVFWSFGKYKDTPVKGTDSGYINWFKDKMPTQSYDILCKLNNL